MHSFVNGKNGVLKVSQRGGNLGVGGGVGGGKLSNNPGIAKPGVNWRPASRFWGCPAQQWLSSPLGSCVFPSTGQRPGEPEHQILVSASPSGYLWTLRRWQELSRFLQAWDVGGKPWLDLRFLRKAFITALLLKKINEVRLTTASLDKHEERKNWQLPVWSNSIIT